MNKIIKEQITQLKPSATLAINEESNRLKKSGKKIYKFGFGQSPFPVPDSIVATLKNHASKNTYLPMQGLEELRSAIANHLNKDNKNNFNSNNSSAVLEFIPPINDDGSYTVPEDEPFGPDNYIWIQNI